MEEDGESLSIMKDTEQGGYWDRGHSREETVQNHICNHYKTPLESTV